MSESTDASIGGPITNKGVYKGITTKRRDGFPVVQESDKKDDKMVWRDTINKNNPQLIVQLEGEINTMRSQLNEFDRTIGITTTTSCSVDQTSAILNEKHNGKLTSNDKQLNETDLKEINIHLDMINGKDPLPKNTLDAFIILRDLIKNYGQKIIEILQTKSNDKQGIIDLIRLFVHVKDLACYTIIVGIKLPSTQIVSNKVDLYTFEPDGIKISILINQLISELLGITQSVPYYHPSLQTIVTILKQVKERANFLVKNGFN